MSEALRTISLPAAGGLSAFTAWRCGSGKLRRTSGRKMKNLLNRAMETPFRMPELYNIWFRAGKKKRGPSVLLWPPAFSGPKKAAKRLRRWCDILRARSQGCTEERIKMVDRRNFMKTCSGMGLAGTLFPGVLWGQATEPGAEQITKEVIDNAGSIAHRVLAGNY